MDVLKDIREVEAKAEETRRGAQAESRHIIQEAKQSAEELIRRSVAEAEQQGQEIMAAAEQESRREIVPIRQRADADVQKLQSGAQAKQEKAIKMVMERIVKTDGHS